MQWREAMGCQPAGRQLAQTDLTKQAALQLEVATASPLAVPQHHCRGLRLVLLQVEGATTRTLERP